MATTAVKIAFHEIDESTAIDALAVPAALIFVECTFLFATLILLQGPEDLKHVRGSPDKCFLTERFVTIEVRREEIIRSSAENHPEFKMASCESAGSSVLLILVVVATSRSLNIVVQ